MNRINASINPLNQIEGHDVFNSEFLLKLRDVETRKFIVQFDEDRIDLICQHIYNQDTVDLTPLLIILNGKTRFKKGDVIKYVDINTLRNL